LKAAHLFFAHYFDHQELIMNEVPFNRRHWLQTASVSALALGSASTAMAQVSGTPGMAPTQWTDTYGLVASLPKDKNPLTNELDKYPRCRYCGMERAKFSHTRHLLVYEDDSVEGTCSIHCAAISLALNMDRGPKAIYAGDAGATGSIKPLALVDNMHYVLDPSKPGTMTKASKFAYAQRAAAEAAAATEAAAQAGAKIVDFNAALTGAYLGMAEDSIMLRKRRAEMRKKMAAGA
jgi:nitrous oxide reductase accessory protein NosL